MNLPGSNLSQLEQRQERLFGQLEQLAVKLKLIKERLQQAPDVVQPKEYINENKILAMPLITHLNDGPIDVVIMMSPDRKPLALLIIYNWLTHAGLNVSFTYHIHSSVHLLPESVRKIFRNLSVLKETETQRSKCHLIFTVIWKEGTDSKLIVSPTTHSIVAGEVNLLRYVASTFLPTLSNENDAIRATEVDHWLDVAHSLSVKHGAALNKERQIVLRALNSQLGKAEYLVGGNQPSIADVGMFCALFQEFPSVADLPANVTKWVNLLCSDPYISLALKAIPINLS